MALQNGLETCTCPRTKCERHGRCAECMEHHSHKKYPCYCVRKRDSAERKRARMQDKKA